MYFFACCFQNIAEKCQAASQLIRPLVHLVLIHLGSSLNQEHLHSTLIYLLVYSLHLYLHDFPFTSSLWPNSRHSGGKLLWFFIDLSRSSDLCTLHGLPFHVKFSLHVHPFSLSCLLSLRKNLISSCSKLAFHLGTQYNHCLLPFAPCYVSYSPPLAFSVL